jgi:hypothetical protein
MLLPAMTAPTVSLADDLRRLLGASAADLLAWGVTRFGPKLAVASSFSIEDCVVIDIASKAARAAKPLRHLTHFCGTHTQLLLVTPHQRSVRRDGRRRRSTPAARQR